MTFVTRKQGAHRRSVAPYAFIVSFGVMSFHVISAGIAHPVPVLYAVAMGWISVRGGYGNPAVLQLVLPAGLAQEPSDDAE